MRLLTGRGGSSQRTCANPLDVHGGRVRRVSTYSYRRLFHEALLCKTEKEFDQKVSKFSHQSVPDWVAKHERDLKQFTCAFALSSAHPSGINTNGAESFNAEIKVFTLTKTCPLTSVPWSFIACLHLKIRK